MAKMLSDTLSLRGLELFEQLALSNSMQEASAKVGLSMSAASQQLRNLEDAVGYHLVDHGARPLKLNAEGRAYFLHIRKRLNYTRIKINRNGIISIIDNLKYFNACTVTSISMLFCSCNRK